MKEESVRYIAIGKPKNTHLGGEPLKNFDELLESVKKANPVKVAVAQANDMEVIETVKMATEKALPSFIW